MGQEILPLLSFNIRQVKFVQLSFLRYDDRVLQITDGRSFSWAPLNFWRTRWVFYDNGDIPVLQFWEGSQEFKISEIFRTQAAVEIMDASLSEEQLSLLVPFGFYLVIMHKNDTAAGAAAASAS